MTSRCLAVMGLRVRGLVGFDRTHLASPSSKKQLPRRARVRGDGEAFMISSAPPSSIKAMTVLSSGTVNEDQSSSVMLSWSLKQISWIRCNNEARSMLACELVVLQQKKTRLRMFLHL